MGVSWLSSVIFCSLEAHHFERTVAYLAWETRSNSLYLEKSKNKILMPVFLAVIQSTHQNPAHHRMALFCAYSHCVIALLVKIWFIISCQESWPLLENLFESCRDFRACSAWDSVTHPRGVPGQRASQGQCLSRGNAHSLCHLSVQSDWKDQSILWSMSSLCPALVCFFPIFFCHWSLAEYRSLRLSSTCNLCCKIGYGLTWVLNYLIIDLICQ